MNFLNSRFNKFGRKQVEIDGIKFASKLEAKVYEFIKLREKCGEIHSLQLQPKVYLSDARILYKPDFVFFDRAKFKDIYVEAKGFETPEWRLKLKLWKTYGPGCLHIYKYKGSRPLLTETIEPIRKPA